MSVRATNIQSLILRGETRKIVRERRGTGGYSRLISGSSVSRASSANRNSLAAASLLGKDLTGNSASQTALKREAAELKLDADKLASTESGSVFDKADTEDGRKALISAIESLVDDYNSLYSKTLRSADGGAGATRLSSAFLSSKKDLASIGITRDGKSMLTIDTDALKSADIDSLKAALNGKSGFAARLSSACADLSKTNSLNRYI